MEIPPTRLDLPALELPSCPDCGMSSDDLASVAEHLEHVASGLSALEQRQLRSHLFALLAGIEGVAPTGAATV